MPAPLIFIDEIALSPQVRMTQLVRPLLEQLLARVSRLRETPLQFEMDTAGTAMAVWSSFVADLPAPDQSLLSNGARLSAALDLVIDEALNGADQQFSVHNADSLDRWESPCSPRRCAETTRGATLDNPIVRLVEWLDELCRTLRATDATAIEVIRLRVEGYGLRDIAGRMGTGVRLARRLLSDARIELEQSRRRG